MHVLSKFLIVLFFLCSGAIQAQMRIGIAAGPAGALTSTATDTAFFGRKYTNTQVRISAHKGRLGIVFSGGQILQKPAKDINPQTVFTGTSGIPINRPNPGDLRINWFTAGPELCFPVGRFKLHTHISAGFSWAKARDFHLTRTGTNDTVYTVIANSDTRGMLKTGFSLHYPVARKLALGFFADFIRCTIPHTTKNLLNTANPVINNPTQKKLLASFTGGLTYKF